MDGLRCWPSTFGVQTFCRLDQRENRIDPQLLFYISTESLRWITFASSAFAHSSVLLDIFWHLSCDFFFGLSRMCSGSCGSCHLHHNTGTFQSRFGWKQSNGQSRTIFERCRTNQRSALVVSSSVQLIKALTFQLICCNFAYFLGIFRQIYHERRQSSTFIGLRWHALGASGSSGLGHYAARLRARPETLGAK